MNEVLFMIMHLNCRKDYFHMSKSLMYQYYIRCSKADTNNYEHDKPKIAEVLAWHRDNLAKGLVQWRSKTAEHPELRFYWNIEAPTTEFVEWENIIYNPKYKFDIPEDDELGQQMAKYWATWANMEDWANQDSETLVDGLGQLTRLPPLRQEREGGGSPPPTPTNGAKK